MRRALPDADRPLVAKPASFSRVASPPQSSFISTPAQGLSALRSPARVSSLFAAPPKASNFRVGAQPIVSSALRLSQPLDGLLHLRLCGPIPSHSHVQGWLSRGFSLRAATFPLREEIPPCRLSEGRCQPNGQLHSQRPATSRLCSARRRVLQGRVEPSSQPLPSSVFSSSRSSFPAVKPSSPGHPLLALPDEAHLIAPPSASCQREGRPACFQVANLLEVPSRPLPFISGEAPIRRWSSS